VLVVVAMLAIAFVLDLLGVHPVGFVVVYVICFPIAYYEVRRVLRHRS
jgi:hypothetical protein